MQSEELQTSKYSILRLNYKMIHWSGEKDHYELDGSP